MDECCEGGTLTWHKEKVKKFETFDLRIWFKKSHDCDAVTSELDVC